MNNNKPGREIHVNGVIYKLRKLFDDIYSGEQNYNKKITKWFVNVYKIFLVSSKKFLEDDCFTKASSIAYSTIMSLIPTLTVILTFYSIFSGVGDKKDEVFARITTFMLEHNIKLNIDPVLDAISSLIENAGKIGGVGAVILVFTATAVLRTLDKTLNNIWNIKIKRSIFLKIIYFWTALSLGPVLIISGNALTNQVTSLLSSPSYLAADISDDGKIWAVGNKASIITSDLNKFDFSPVSSSKIDFDNQHFYSFDSFNKTLIKQEFRVEELEYANTKFSGIQFKGKFGWIISKNGLLLITNNTGETWDIRKLGSLELNDIFMFNQEYGFITADNGYLLQTDDGWQTIVIRDWQDITTNLKSISFSDTRGIITGERGLILSTNDAGKTWTHKILEEAQIKKNYSNINNAYFFNKSEILLACDEGLILTSSNSGRTWERKRFYDKNYNTAVFTDTQTGFLAGTKGIFISTNDGGKTWRRQKLSISNVNSLLLSGNNILAIGDNGMLLKSNDYGQTWDGKKGKSIVLYITNFLAPFLYIWILFLLIYLFFPNAKIPFKPAAIGAAFTGAVWVIFILSFEVYIKGFAKGSQAIYGALAAIPLFLLMVYISVLIVLYGAEVSYTLMYPHTYLKLKKKKNYDKNINIYNGISVLHYIYKKFENGNGFTNKTELIKLTGNNTEELNYYLDIFSRENLVTGSFNDNIAPSNASKNVMLTEVISLIHDVNLAVPGIISKKDNFKYYINGVFEKIIKSREGIIQGITLADVIDKTK